MIPIQAIALIYAGMLVESPDRRKQFMNFINGAGTSVEKIVNDFTSKGGAVNNAPVETATEEDIEFK